MNFAYVLMNPHQVDGAVELERRATAKAVAAARAISADEILVLRVGAETLLRPPGAIRRRARSGTRKEACAHTSMATTLCQ